jgi:hypothetical protein
LSRLLLSVPPSGALVIIALVHNILRRHPSVNCLVHRVKIVSFLFFLFAVNSSLSFAFYIASMVLEMLTRITWNYMGPRETNEWSWSHNLLVFLNSSI